MAVDAEISRQHIRQELASVEQLATSCHWEVLADYASLVVLVKMKACTGDPYIVEARCDDYKEVPPFFEFIDPETGLRGGAKGAGRGAEKQRIAGEEAIGF